MVNSSNNFYKRLPVARRIRTPAPVGTAVRPRPEWRPASPRAEALGLSSVVAAMSAHPEEQGSPSCKANVHSRTGTGRPKLVKFNAQRGRLPSPNHENSAAAYAVEQPARQRRLPTQAPLSAIAHSTVPPPAATHSVPHALPANSGSADPEAPRSARHASAQGDAAFRVRRRTQASLWAS